MTRRARRRGELPPEYVRLCSAAEAARLRFRAAQKTAQEANESLACAMELMVATADEVRRYVAAARDAQDTP